MLENKFRAWVFGRYYYNVDIRYEINIKKYYIFLRNEPVTCDVIEIDNKNILEQYIGLHDRNVQEYYVGDIGQFDHGDTFIICMEEYLQVYLKWIGEPKCTDQARDLYRIELSTKIGNIHENPELLNNN